MMYSSAPQFMEFVDEDGDTVGFDVHSVLGYVYERGEDGAVNGVNVATAMDNFHLTREADVKRFKRIVSLLHAREV